MSILLSEAKAPKMLQIQPPFELSRTLSLHLSPFFCIIHLPLYRITPISKQIDCYLSTLEILHPHCAPLIRCPFIAKHIKSVHSGSGSQSEVLRLEASASPRKLLEMQIPRNHLRPSYSVRNSGPRNLGFTSPPGDSDNHFGLRTTICALWSALTLLLSVHYPSHGTPCSLAFDLNSSSALGADSFHPSLSAFFPTEVSLIPSVKFHDLQSHMRNLYLP